MKKFLKEAYIGNGKLINSDFLNNLNVDDAKNKIIEKIEAINIGKKKTLGIKNQLAILCKTLIEKRGTC